MWGGRFFEAERSAATRPPGPRGSWTTGNLAGYEADRLGFLLEARRRFGGVVRFGPRTTILNDPAVVASMLRDPDFIVSENFLQRRLSAADQEQVRALRTVLSPGLRPAVQGGVAALVCRNLMPALERLGSEWFDPMPVLESAISSAVAEFYFGPDGLDLTAQLGELLDELSQVIGNPFALPEQWGSPVRRRIAARHEQLRARVTDLLAERRDAPAGAYDDLAAGVVARAGDRYPLPQVADMVIGSLLASQRVPAAAASWLLMTLADHPEVQEQIAAQAGPTRAGCGAPPEHGPAIAQRVVLEVLRLFPPTWLLVRTASREVEVGGYSFAAGHHFMISPYVLHRDAEAFPEPTLFRPDRWRQPMSAGASYLPYGGGVHVCPGRHLATSILTAIASALTGRYRILRSPAPVTPNPRTTLFPDGLRTALREAGSSSDQLPAWAGASPPR